ncbi:hypothetical protein M23134_06061 [Microscilla marina ATCC 23134]|uniref:Uncharacterized protein n=1 Tax=Microscilla marina ATCC 23134 TaxID=313606 RepID=A1ZWZ3_MICM2|nr:hypothetical protein M23134_06061 [Microscilla marina ATCC 23134]
MDSNGKAFLKSNMGFAIDLFLSSKRELCLVAHINLDNKHDNI